MMNEIVDGTKYYTDPNRAALQFPLELVRSSMSDEQQRN